MGEIKNKTFEYLKLGIPLVIVVFLFSMCVNKQEFSSDRWAFTDDDGYPYRKKIVGDLIDNHLNLCGNRIMELLGEPTVIESKKSQRDFIYYFIETKNSLNFDPYYSNYLELKIDKDSCILQSKIVKL